MTHVVIPRKGNCGLLHPQNMTAQLPSYAPPTSNSPYYSADQEKALQDEMLHEKPPNKIFRNLSLLFLAIFGAATLFFWERGMDNMIRHVYSSRQGYSAIHLEYYYVGYSLLAVHAFINFVMAFSVCCVRYNKRPNTRRRWAYVFLVSLVPLIYGIDRVNAGIQHDDRISNVYCWFIALAGVISGAGTSGYVYYFYRGI